MSEPKFIISEKQILNAVKYALELNIQEQKIVDILMHDVEDEIETVLYDDCEEVAEEKENLINKTYATFGEDRSLFKEEENECKKCAEEHRQLAEWLIELKQLREQTKWIPVSEGMPNKYVDVICCTDAKEVFIATYLGKMNDGTDCFDDYDGMMWEGDIIAWMPLPEPYKPKESEKKK